MRNKLRIPISIILLGALILFNGCLNPAMPQDTESDSPISPEQAISQFTDLHGEPSVEDAVTDTLILFRWYELWVFAFNDGEDDWYYTRLFVRAEQSDSGDWQVVEYAYYEEVQG